MRLTVIGCSGSFPGPDSAASCYLVEHETVSETGERRTWRLLLDLGNGALGALQRHVDPFTIDAVFLSHLHADHCLDLCGYYVMRKYHPSGAQPRIPVHGPADSARRLAKAYDLDEDPGMNEEFDFIEYDAAPVTVGPFTVTPTKVVHPIPAYALRVEAGGRAIAYTGDTAACAAVVESARGADLLLAEAAFREGDENPPGIHLTGREAGEAAREAGVGRLVLTHIPAWYDPELQREHAARVWDGPLDVAVAGATYDV